MKILVTGAEGFVGRNLCAELVNRQFDVLKYDLSSGEEALETYCREADFVFHLAGVNRPVDEQEFFEGNADFSAHLCDLLKKNGRTIPIAMTSSIQAALDNAYGKSKVLGEEALFAYREEMGAAVYVFRLPNIFGKWSRPNYNSMVATFCHNIARGEPITIHSESAIVPLLYIDDLVEVLIALTEGEEPQILTKGILEDLLPHTKREQIEKALEGHTYYTAGPVHKESVGHVAELLYSFRESRESKMVPYLQDGFEKKLYSTYLSFLPEDSFAYDLKMNEGVGSTFTELIKSEDRGQVSVNIIQPGITKGNHWHQSKNEKFIVVSGHGIIRLRRLDSVVVLEYLVSSDQIRAVDIPPGYTHNITNLGEDDLVTVMWANEPFDPENPDTYYLEV